MGKCNEDSTSEDLMGHYEHGAVGVDSGTTICEQVVGLVTYEKDEMELLIYLEDPQPLCDC